MKKTIILVFAVAVSLALTGCAKKQVSKQNQNQNQAMEQNKGGVISSIKDAMGLGKKMKCTYTMKIGNETDTYVSYIEGKKYKSESEFDGKTQYSVFDGEAMYSWNNKDKNGTKMEVKCLEDLNKPEENKPSATAETLESLKNPDEQFNDAMETKCEDVASIDFAIPSDVTFKDQCEEMKKMMENLKKYQNQMPSQIPSGAIPGGAGSQ